MAGPRKNQFQPGHTGRPKGSRNRLTGDFLKALAEDFAEHGIEAIRIVRIEEPAKYLTVVAGLMPKQVELEAHTTFSDMSDDEIDAALAKLQALTLDAVADRGASTACLCRSGE
jgi:hypothetical protein